MTDFSYQTSEDLFHFFLENPEVDDISSRNGNIDIPSTNGKITVPVSELKTLLPAVVSLRVPGVVIDSYCFLLNDRVCRPLCVCDDATEVQVSIVDVTMVCYPYGMKITSHFVARATFPQGFGYTMFCPNRRRHWSKKKILKEETTVFVINKNFRPINENVRPINENFRSINENFCPIIHEKVRPIDRSLRHKKRPTIANHPTKTEKFTPYALPKMILHFL